MTVTVWRFRLAALCLLLVTLAFLQSPGETAADTKLDLTVDPFGFLARALDLWEPQGFFGQVQNQAYGYLFPMGPFFALGAAVDLPAWVVQRLWWAVLLCAGFLGAVRLTGLLLRAGSDKDRLPAVRLAQVLAGLAYVLAPRMVSTLGPISAESLPMAMAPWMLVPLVLADRGRSPRRMAALSALAVLGAGAVNAVATVAILPLAVVWLLTRPAGRRAVAAWWVAAVGLVSLWWFVPLLLLGRYSPPFLDWIESAAVTTRPNEVGTVLRGASHWIPYVVEPGGPVWPAGFALVSDGRVIAAAVVVAGLGLLGLVRRDLAERAFLAASVAVGVVLVSVGHTGPLQGLGAEAVQDLLDGPLAPLRNVHKADPVLRLPLAVSAAALVAALWAEARQRTPGLRRAALRLLPVAMVAATVLASWPIWTGDLTSGRTHGGLPDYWEQAADWLGAQGDERALVVPGSSFGVYIWGRTQDEPLQPLASGPWAVRDAVPLSSAGNIRMLDAVDSVLTTGRGSVGLAEVLARSGVRWVVVRNDLSSDAAPPRSILLRQGLERSPGLVRRAAFGPVLPPYRTPAEVIDDGLQEAARPIEIWEVDTDVAPPAVLRDVDGLLRVVGGPEGLLPLAEAGVLGQRPTVLAGEPSAADLGGRDVLTDTYRRTEVNFGSVRSNRSETLTADDPFVLDRGVRDYYPVEPEGRQPTAVEDGYAIRASSTGADVDALRGRAPSSQPWSAVDGDPATAWISGDLVPGVGQWWEVEWEEARRVDRLPVRLVVGGPTGVEPARVQVTTDGGSVTSDVLATDAWQSLPVEPGPTTRVRVTLLEVADGTEGDAFGLAEVRLPGEPLRRPVQTVETSPEAIVLSARGGEVSGCVHRPTLVSCSRRLVTAGEERSGVDRQVTLDAPAEYAVSVTVRPRPGLALDRLLEPPSGAATVEASSQLVSDPAAGPLSAVDGDRRTAWYADPLDRRPTLTVSLPELASVSGITVDNPPERASSSPLGVTVRDGSAVRQGFLDEQGRLRFPPLRTDGFDIEFGLPSPLRSRDPTTGATAQLPLAISELSVLGAEDQLGSAGSFPRVGVPCGLGPEVRIDGSVVGETSVDADASAVLETRVLGAESCGASTVTLSEGEHRIVVDSTAEFLVERVDLVPVADIGDGAPVAAQVERWGTADRVVVVPPADRPRLLETTENANAGWQAWRGGTALDAVVVDGWRQAWLVPPGVSGEVRLSYSPQPWYRVGLAVGLVAALVVVAAAVRRGRGVVVPPRAGSSPGKAWPVLVLVMTAAVGGLVGVACGALALVVSRARPSAVPRVVAGAWGVGGAIAVAWPWPASQSAPSWVVLAAGLAALSALALAVSPTRR